MASRSVQYSLLAVVAIAFILFLTPWPSAGSGNLFPVTAGAMSVTHTVLFQWKKDASPDRVRKACAKMLALKDTCVHPGSNKPYILSLKGGKDNSIEGKQSGITHGFVVDFASVEDRDYYVDRDPSHDAFKESIGDLVENVIVVDFTDGTF